MKKTSTLFVFVLFSFLAFCTPAKPTKNHKYKSGNSTIAGVIYVNKANTSGTYNGLSWSTAYNDLQTAITAATAGNTIWVAKGTYYPTTSTTDRGASFTMKNDVAIYGGFSGNESSLSDRNVTTNATILSGDIDQNDAQNNITGNSYNVIRNGNTTTNTAVLDGFIIAGGYANGGGITLSNGGAVNNDGRGGACNPVFRNCIFRYNIAQCGGAVAIFGDNSNTCTPTFTNCVFNDNKAILNSTSSDAGALYCVGNITVTLTNCTFSKNYALGSGGAINISANFGSVNAILSNCIIWGNSADRLGSQLYSFISTYNLSNTILEGGISSIGKYGNAVVANDNGGNIYTDPLFTDAANGDFTLKPCSPGIDVGASGGNTPSTDIRGNARVDVTGVGTTTIDLGAYETQSQLPAAPTVNAPATKKVITPATLTLTASSCSGTVNWSNGGSGTSITLSATGAYTISATCTVDGCTSAASTSVTGLEIQRSHRIYVNKSNSSSGDGLSWATAYNDLQTALIAARTNDTLWVAKGTYYPTTNATDRGASFTMKNDVAIYGGFSGNESRLSDRSIATNATILSGDIDQNDGENNFTGNSYNVIRNGNTTTNTAVLDGFIISGGYSNGGGIVLSNGGAVNNDGRGGTCNPVFRNCIFRYNIAQCGGAVAIFGDNTNTCTPTFTNCVFNENKSILNSTLSDGGALYCVGNMTVTLSNCTFSKNYALGSGGAIFITSNSGRVNAILSNCIIWGNSASSGNQLYNAASIYNLSSTILEGGISGISIYGNNVENNDNGGNIYTDPFFTDAANGDFTLKPCSPGIDVGASGGNTPSTDIRGNARVDVTGVGTTTIDLGAYETQSQLPAAPTVNAPATKKVITPATLTLTASSCSGTVNWSNGGSGTSITLSATGTYTISATCTVDGCASLASTSITGLEIQRPHRIYVNKSNSSSGDGLSWATAYNDLQTALIAATTNDTLWVAKGTYYPTTNATDRGASFTMKNDVAIYGGFSGNESRLSDRSIATNATILSGDIDQNDGENNFTGNSYNVIINGNTTTNTAVLDGFIISGGYGSTHGGAVYNDGNDGICNPVFRNCIFRYNAASRGGAVGNYANNGSASPTFTNCVFYENKAMFNGALSNGGAMFCQDGATATLTNCTFSKNNALGKGGAIASGTNSGSPKITLVNCIIWGNSASLSGNQIYNYASIYNLSNTILEGGISGISFLGNNMENNDNGGNIYTDPLFTDAANGDFTLKPCSPGIDVGVSGGNTPDTDILGNPRFDVTGVGTTTIDLGAYETQNQLPAAPTVNAPATKKVITPATLTLTASSCSGTVNWSNGGSGTSITLSATGTYTISATCTVDGCASLASTSITGLEIQRPHRIYVNKSNSSSGDGLSWATAYNDLQTAIAAATTNDTLWVAKGTYYPTTSTTDRDATFTMKNDVAIYGGFSGNESRLSDRNVATNATILSGDIDQNDAQNNIAGNSYNVIRNGNTIINTAILDGFIISGGYADGGTIITSNGGAVNNDGRNGVCNPVFRNCIFRYNIARSGGAVANFCNNNGTSTPTFTNCVFNDNKSILNNDFSDGGAMYCAGNMTVTLTNCTFSKNYALGSGGAINIATNFGNVNAILSNCIIWGNSANRSGNQLYNFTSIYNLSNTILEGGISGIGRDNDAMVANDNGGNIYTDPLFTDAANGDFTLKPCSPGIDVGASGGNTPDTDIRGNARFDVTGVGTSTIDLGAYETQSQLPAAPTVTAPTTLVVCSPSTLTLTASCATGTVLWSNSSTGTSLTLSSVGTYAISAKCVSNGCESDASSTSNLEIKAKPTAPTVTPPANLVVCSPSTLTLTASCATGTVLWSNSSTGTSLTLSSVGTY
uniref:beta strand repeat-containing protein n=1 Tax=Emticicia sp. 17c TaxID=3127704 RepID=UPI00301C6E3A